MRYVIVHSNHLAAILLLMYRLVSTDLSTTLLGRAHLQH
jgi:hypothetical protein